MSSSVFYNESRGLIILFKIANCEAIELFIIKRRRGNEKGLRGALSNSLIHVVEFI